MITTTKSTSVKELQNILLETTELTSVSIIYITEDSRSKSVKGVKLVENIETRELKFVPVDISDEDMTNEFMPEKITPGLFNQKTKQMVSGHQRLKFIPKPQSVNHLQIE